jgi:hypothetical protein
MIMAQRPVSLECSSSLEMVSHSRLGPDNWGFPRYSTFTYNLTKPIGANSQNLLTKSGAPRLGADLEFASRAINRNKDSKGVSL